MIKAIYNKARNTVEFALKGGQVVGEAGTYISEIISVTGVTYVTGVGGGGSSPSGTVTHNVQWMRRDKIITVWESVAWSVAGSAVLHVRWDNHAFLPHASSFAGQGRMGSALASATSQPYPISVYMNTNGGGQQIQYTSMNPTAGIALTNLNGTFTYITE